jgi:hypothetical protein
LFSLVAHPFPGQESPGDPWFRVAVLMMA